MTRGKVAELFKINAETVRYYEDIGLIKPDTDKTTNYRHYDERIISKIDLILKFKKLGFSLKEIRTFFDLISSSSEDPARFNRYLTGKIREIDEKIGMLQSVKKSLISFRDREDKETCRVFSKFVNKA